MTGMLPELQENDDFYFDEAAADRTVRFIEKYCRHYEGRFAGCPFLLHPAQKRIVRDVFGWKWRSTGMRRFTDVYFEAAIGAGKSPLLAAIGLYCLMADNEPGAQVYSLASNYGQARIVFEAAKRFVQESPDLEKRLEVTQFEIRHPRSKSFWRIVSGKGPGAGCRPTCILADEVHEWPNACGYTALRDRMAKRQQPLLVAATNAGESRTSFCYQLREKAVAVLKGQGDVGLYPIIWAADEEDATDDAAAWRMANPLLGVTVDEGKVRRKCDESIDDEIEEPAFRRLYMGIWPNAGAGRWLDMKQWDTRTGAIVVPADAATYVGMDLSLGDDLCAVVTVRVTPAMFYLDGRFWMPKATAEIYQKRYAVAYSDWAKEGYVDLLKERTIDSAVHGRIAQYVVGLSKTQNVKAVCYDRYKASETVAAIEAAGIPCVPVAQGYSVSPGCHELERRLKDGSITVAGNKVLRFCAENAEVKQDDRGNFWPVKPNEKGKYAGTRWKKIDAISAAVTALTEARKHAFPAARKMWKGSVHVA